MSEHLAAKKGEIAKIVLLPGDPLRAKHIANEFLTDPVCYNTVRNALGYTGTYKGVRISVQGTGIGIPTTLIYAEELINYYGYEVLIRVGTCGGMAPKIKVRDVVLAQSATTDSAIIQNDFGSGIYYAPTADFALLNEAYHIAKSLGINVKVGNIISEDRFYNDEIEREKLIKYNVLGAEMEAAGLYLVAAKYNVKALAVLTISNHIIDGTSTAATERERSFNDMVKVALETAVQSQIEKRSDE